MAASQFKAEWPTFALCRVTQIRTQLPYQSTPTRNHRGSYLHPQLHTHKCTSTSTSLSPRTNAFAVSCGQVYRNWKEQPRASPQTQRTKPGARHWQPAINTNACSLRSRWHPRHHPCNTPAHTYKRLPPAPSLSFLHHLSLIPTPVCHHGNSTHREACHRFWDARAIGKRTHTRSHSLAFMHACRTRGIKLFREWNSGRLETSASLPSHTLFSQRVSI